MNAKKAAAAIARGVFRLITVFVLGLLRVARAIYLTFSQSLRELERLMRPIR